METILEQIRDYADLAHDQQLRKYTSDRYIVHPIRMMETCRDCDPRLPLLAAALLHDVLEDTAVQRDQMLHFLQTLMDDDEPNKPCYWWKK